MDQPLANALLAVILTRAAERTLLVLAGALCIYLGYRLFAAVPTDRSEGKISLPGDVSIVLTRVGPGVFFALFGCAIIGYSVTKPVEFSMPTELAGGRGAAPATMQAGVDGTIHYSGIGSGPSAPDVPTIIARLNSFTERQRANLERPAMRELEEAIRAARLSLMLTNWSREWGDRVAFSRWVQLADDSKPPPAGTEGAWVVYRTGQR